jgi:hypothetical protein
LKYEIVSDRPCFIDAVGELQPGVSVVLTDEQLDLFKVMHGVRITEARFPPDVFLTTIVEEGK